MRVRGNTPPAGLDGAVVGVPLDTGTSNRPGARFGPRGIRDESVLLRPYNMATRAAPFDSLRIDDTGDVAASPYDLLAAVEAIEEHFDGLLADDVITASMGGDHTVVLPILRAMAKKHGPVGLVHIDAHTDFGDSNALGGRYHHGTMVRRISENPMIDYKNLAWVGLNSPVTLDQYELKRNHNLKMTTAQNVRERGIVDIMNDAMETASDGVDAVYVSIDIDVIDAHESTGTGSPEFHGVTTNEFFEAMDMLSRFDMLGAFDLCEVSPEWDPSGQTVRIATSGILKILAPRLFDSVDPSKLSSG